MNDLAAFELAHEFAARQASDAAAHPIVLDAELELLADTFRNFAADKVRPIAERLHRKDELIPAGLITELAEMGCFGLTIPAEYGGLADGTSTDWLRMAVVTEELSRASLAAGSLITRGEILSRALVTGGSPSQRSTWLPRLATGETLAAVAVTEPDHGSDVANLKTTATKTADGWVLNGAKTWCTFAGYADVLAVLARTQDTDPPHRGLSLFLVEKPRFETRAFTHGGISGRAIPTIGYRGMHSFELALEDVSVPDDHLIGEPGQGFYLQMEGFTAGRLQTAARAVGVMQAAWSAAEEYAHQRIVFGRRLADLSLTRHKLEQMAERTDAARQLTYRAALSLDVLPAAVAKLYACKNAEWVTREAMQIHGGMGYAEEYAVSRYFLDARVLTIFEGAEEVLALKVITPRVPT